MKQSIKKSLQVILFAILALGISNCDIINPKKKSDDTGLLLLGAFLLSQNQPVVAKANLVAKVKKADDTRFTEAVMATITGGATNTDSSARDFSTVANGAADDGNLNFTLDLTSFNSNVSFKVESKRSGTEGDKPEDFTDRVGDFTVNININREAETGTASVVSANGLTVPSVEITAVTILGVYPSFAKSEGEKVCDGDKVNGGLNRVSGTINTPQNWSNAVLLTGTVIVNAAVTIQPGTVIFGQRGSSLFVLGNNKLTAIGTAENPICFTSSQQLGSRFPGDWGGIVTVGDHGSTRASTTEGTTPQPYGSNSSDATWRNRPANVVMKYAIIEFGGNEVAPGDELNNLSMYATGSELEFVQAHRGLDDQFEQWGGKITWSKVLATGGLDDDYDLDEGVSGTITNAIGHKYPVSCGGSPSTDPHGLEWDGTHNNGADPCPAYGCTTVTLNKFTLIGSGITSGQAARLRERVKATINNGVYYGFVQGFDARNVAADSSQTTVSMTNVRGDQALRNFADDANPANFTNDLGTTLPIVSDAGINGSSSSCGFRDAKPDYTLIASANSALGATDGVGKFWETWAVFRGR